jgi:hypothetical protein
VQERNAAEERARGETNAVKELNKVAKEVTRHPNPKTETLNPEQGSYRGKTTPTP